ncbi:serine/threonine protein kinase [Amycolatopsis orientalis]|uniref:Serine/threonine protein kinase n=1 Tax=Amycolatopsis orientalis TaxID=31958 RepID=A0A193C2M5_AMYOR|nr:ATP-binding protein [Amycolatopsis orientalis]ANN18781.1 serine/threonine protein kinase [Amycolatopsis orientalis]
MLPDELTGSAPAVPAREHVVQVEEDLLTARHAVRAGAVAVGFSIVDQTKIVTAASELVRNAYIHGGGGVMTITVPRDERGRIGLRLRVRDNGPGIADVEQAMTDGFSTGAGLGHGLGGTRRLVDEFHLDTTPGRGTTVTITRWKT